MNNDKNNCSIPPVGLTNMSRQGQKKIKKIKNLYNTCYINSSIQCLFRLEQFINNILNSSEGKLSNATKNLIINMRDNNNDHSKLHVSKIKKEMIEYNEKYKYNNQEDANEFISDYLNVIHKENRIKDNNNEINQINNRDENYSHFLKKFHNKGHSFISDLFYGVLRTKNFCKNCGEIFSVKYQSFNILDMPLYYLAIKKENKDLDIEDVITSYISEKEFSNAKCNKCQKKAYTKMDIYKLPKYLIMYFERKADNYYIENDINIKKTIDLTNFLDEKESNELCYSLKGVIHYSFFGNNNGHYTASCLIDNDWYYFDDDNYKISKEMIKYKGDNTVLLFYEKNN